MELNGVANIVMLADQIEELVNNNKSQFGEIGGLAHKIKQQCDILERYMLAYKDIVDLREQNTRANIAKDNLTKYPFWHEIKAHKKKYPTLKERVGV